MIDHKTYMRASTAIFGVVALFHLLRVINGWSIEIGGWMVPGLASWIALIVAGTLAYNGYKQQH